MLGYDYWKTLGARTDIAGQTLILDGELYSIAGVLPADFFLQVRDAKLIVPDLRITGNTIARLHPGVTPAQAQAEIASLVRGGRAQVTGSWRDGPGWPLLLVARLAILLTMQRAGSSRCWKRATRL